MRNMTFALLAAVCALCLAASFAPAENSGYFDVEASLNKESIIVGEPLFIIFKVTNKTPREQEFRTRLSPHGDIRVVITHPERLPLDYKAHFPTSFAPYYVFKIPPGRTERFYFTLLYEEQASGGILFDRPGEFVIQTSMSGMIQNQTEQYRFGPFKVVVTAPEADDARALELLGRKELILGIHKGFCAPSDRPALDQILQRFPRSTYAPYILNAIAGGILTEGKDDPEAIREAIGLYTRYVKEYPGTVFEDDAVYKVGQCHDMLGEGDEARRWFIRLFNNYPDSNRLNYSDYLIKKYILITPKPHPYNQWMLFDGPNDPEPEVIE